jgi:hypothetical protein
MVQDGGYHIDVSEPKDMKEDVYQENETFL